MGTIHSPSADNKSMGGTVRVASHLDGLVKAADRLVRTTGSWMEDGRLLILTEPPGSPVRFPHLEVDPTDPDFAR